MDTDITRGPSDVTLNLTVAGPTRPHPAYPGEPGHDPTAWTREPLPPGRYTVPAWPTCRACASSDIVIGGPGQTHHVMMRTVTATDAGQWLIQFHDESCPIWTEPDPRLPCPTCQAPTHSYTFHSAYLVEINDVDMATGEPVVRRVRDTPEVLRAYPRGAATGRRFPDPDRDTLDLEPCGHVILAPAAHDLTRRVRELLAADEAAAAQATLTTHADLLAAAEERGQGSLADAYRRAVNSGGGTLAPGLLTALKIITGRQGSP